MDQPPRPRVLSPMRGRPAGRRGGREPAPEPPTGSRRGSTRPAGVAPAARRLDGKADGRPKASPLARRLAKERGVELGQSQGSGPGGRIVKADVEAAASASAGAGAEDDTRHRGRGSEAGSISAFSRPSGSRADAGIFGTRDREGPGGLRGPLQAPVHGRPADGRVEGDRAALLPAGRGRHEPRRRGQVAAEIGGAGGRGRALVQRHGRQGVRARPPRASARQRRLPRRPLRALLAGQRRGRGRGPRLARRADRLRRRPQGAARDRRRLARVSPSGSATARSPRPSSRARPSPSRTWGCTGSTASRR